MLQVQRVPLLEA